MGTSLAASFLRELFSKNGFAHERLLIIAHIGELCRVKMRRLHVTRKLTQHLAAHEKRLVRYRDDSLHDLTGIKQLITEKRKTAAAYIVRFYRVTVFPVSRDGVDVAFEVHGNAQIQGDVEGDVHADGNVTCEDVEGNVRAGGQVTCADVEGDVTAGGQITCADVEGDVSAGIEVTCATVEGDVHVQGDSDRVFVNCAEIEGDLTVLNASVTCEGAICGNVDVRGDGPERSIVICAGIEGDAAVLNASVNCQDGVISGNVDVRGEQPDKCVVVCGGVEGSVTARNATVSCGDGSVDGDIDAQSDWDEEA